VVAHQPDVSVVLTTYNRARVLSSAIEGLLDQDLTPTRYEIIIVDNNSTDDTRQVVESFRSRADNVRYLFEARQGISFGRNAGVRAARAPLIAFTDDDVRVARDWIRTIVSVLESHPEVVGVGGKVLPDWSGPWPTWLTREHWSPLALVDHGETPFYVTASRRVCLITANAAYRREVFDRFGLFSLDVQGVEDHELLLRVWRAGEQGLYWPWLTATALIDPDRMRRRYHRRWHRRHGRFLARMHDEEFERTRMGRFLGVPAHIYRRLAAHLGGWIAALIRGRFDAAFNHELGLWSASGFLASRWRELCAPGRRTAG
jgi:glycosyltransferase involved in cell wall biosynthesis